MSSLFSKTVSERILILDGAMGTMIQRKGLVSDERLNVDRPDVILGIHREYIEAGADIIETNTFSTDSRELILAGTRLAREAADTAGRKVWVAGSMGPTSKSLSLAVDASDPSFRECDFEQMRAFYARKASALVDGGVDLILLETCFDALNAKAAIKALADIGCDLPLIVSATVADKSGRTLTGQTLEAFYLSISHAANLSAFGINCSLGASQMAPLVGQIAEFSSHPVIFFPNAGLPDENGEYNDGPENMASVVTELAGKGLLNIVGGCCGTTPAHISAIAGALRGVAPRAAVEEPRCLRVCGLDAVTIDKSLNFTNIGERTNVAGSRKFARLISEGKYDEALSVASDQIEGGAAVIDINMDDPMLDSTEQMRTFLRWIASDPSVSKAAIMVDSSRWETVETALENVQGRSIVNSISLKEGETEFLRKALYIRDMGAAMVVMAFDEEGQATTFERKIEICRRSYDLLTNAGIKPQDIIFDVNVLSIGTGVAEHSRFGVDFIEAVRWIKKNLPASLTSGGISNLSFAFRGNNAVREAMHSAFLYHAVEAGLDMAIVNPQMLQIYDNIDSDLLQRVEDVIFDRREDATARLVEKASEVISTPESGVSGVKEEEMTSVERLRDAVIKGGSSRLEEDVIECIDELGGALAVVEGPLMGGMDVVGRLFAEGKMFLPQVVKSAKIMRDAVTVLDPYMKASGEESTRPKFLIATVRGDVHDIGKNITASVLQCSGFEVIDMGVMVPSEDIVAKAEELQVDALGVSGLITPSLTRMEELCTMLASSGSRLPLFVGGAAASAVHTAVKLAPLYSNVHYGADASSTAVKAKKYMTDREVFLAAESDEQARLRAARCERSTSGTPLLPDIKDFVLVETGSDLPLTDFSLEELLPLFDWRMFDAICGVRKDACCSAEAEGFRKEAIDYLRTENLSAQACIAYMAPVGASAPEVGIFAIKVEGDDADLVHHAARATMAEAASSLLSGKYGSDFLAIGYPCCPDHSVKKTVLDNLPIDIKLTEGYSMLPEASICGMFLPEQSPVSRTIS